MKYKVNCKKIYKWLFYSIIFLIFQPSLVFATTGPVSDLSFSIYQEKSNIKHYNHVFSTKFSRNLIKNENHFWETNYEGNILDSLDINNELKLSHPLEESFNFLKNISMLQNTFGFFILSYSRPAYTNQQRIQNTCWQSTICLNNINIGLSWSSDLINHITDSASIYLTLPSSKYFFQKSFLFGIGASLSTKYLFCTNSIMQCQFLSSHSIDVNLYAYQTGNKNSTIYNIPLITSHQAGWKISIKKLFISDIFILSNYKFSINFNGTPFHNVSIKIDNQWPISKNLKLIAGFNWGDNILRPQDTALAVHTVFFNPDKTIFSLGANYFF